MLPYLCEPREVYHQDCATAGDPGTIQINGKFRENWVKSVIGLEESRRNVCLTPAEMTRRMRLQ